jgi:ribosome-associated protein
VVPAPYRPPPEIQDRSENDHEAGVATPREAPAGRHRSFMIAEIRSVQDTVRMAATDDPSGDLVVTGSVVVPAAALNWRFSRSSGPGGQGVNTADSRVELSVAPLEIPGLTEHQQQRMAGRLASRLVDGVLTIAASEHRQQLRNRQAARERLAAVLRAALAPPPPSRRRTKPTRGSQERRIEAKKQRGQLKKQRRSWD